MTKWIELLIRFVGLFQCWTYIQPYEEALVMRCGKFNRWHGPGWCWLIPLGIESNTSENVKPEPVKLEVQSLHSSDGFAVNICVGMEYEIVDLKTHTLDFEDTLATNTMVAAGVVTVMVKENKFDDITDALVKKQLSTINRKIKKRGAHITEIVLQDLSSGEAVRYWHEGIEIG